MNLMQLNKGDNVKKFFVGRLKILKSIIITIILLIFTVLTGCRSDTVSVRLKHGQVDTVQVRDIGRFNKVELDGNFIVNIKNGSKTGLTLEGYEDILNNVLTEVENGTLKIGFMNYQYAKLEPAVIVNLQVTNINEITGRKYLKVTTPDILQFNELYLDFAGAVNLDLRVSGNKMRVVLAGATVAVMDGKVDSLILSMPGAGKLDAQSLKAKYVDTDIAGTGKADVTVTEQLRVNMAGACYVSYRGNPSCIYSNIIGIGRLKKIEE